MELEKWLIDFTEFYTKLGFLEKYNIEDINSYVDTLIEFDYDNINDLEFIIDDCEYISDIFKCDFTNTNNSDINRYAEIDLSDNKMHDLRLLGLLDGNKVWWRWKENDYYFQATEGRKPFTEIIKRLSQISRGSFIIDNIKQIAGKDENNVFISFDYNNQPRTLSAKYKIEDVGFGKIILPDLEILKEINSLIRGTGFSFEIYERVCGKDGIPDEYMPFNSTAYILVLNEDEKEIIKSKRGWCF